MLVYTCATVLMFPPCHHVDIPMCQHIDVSMCHYDNVTCVTLLTFTLIIVPAKQGISLSPFDQRTASYI